MRPRAFLFNPPDRRAQGVSRKTSTYCNLTHAVVDGLTELGVDVSCEHAGPIDWPTTPRRPDYTLYLVQRHSDLDSAAVFKWLEEHGCLHRTAFIDASDTRFGLDWFWANSEAHYFKTDNHPRFGVHTLPYCIHHRYLPDTRPAAQDVVFFVCRLSTHPDRPRIRDALERGGWRCEFGPIADSADARVRRYRGIPHYHNAAYFQRLNACKVAVNAPGGAFDCYRYWEIAASHAVLVSFPVEQRLHGFPNPPTPGVHYVPYHSADDVNAAVAEAFDRYDRLHDAQRRFFLANHRAVNRASTVLNQLGVPTPVGPPFCLATGA